jgi:glycosyltransferase involved in cell wall biosynthesis
MVKISCLLVTSPVPERFGYLKRSLEAYCRQTHPNRELVVVVDEGAPEHRAAFFDTIAACECPDIEVIELAERRTLGALRNASRAAASGEVLCQWDDDDLYHPERLARQFAALEKSASEAVLLQEVMQYFPQTHEMVWTNWISTETKGHPGTLMCWQDVPIRYPETGPSATRGEDTEVVRQLHARGRLTALGGMPHLYIYVSHGKNTYDHGHHRMLAQELSISQGLLRRREMQLRESLSVFDLGAEPITVMGNNGPAFTLELAGARSPGPG